MERSEQLRIAQEIAEVIRAALVGAVEGGGVPADWDGIELKQYAVDKVRELYGSTHLMDRARLRSYRSVVRTNYL